MPTNKGTTGPLSRRSTRRFVHGQGWTLVEERTGTEAAVLGQVLAFKQQGYDVTVDGDGPTRTLTATKQAVSETNDQDFYDRYTIHKETIQKSIWFLDAVQTEGNAYFSVPPAPPESGFAAYRKGIQSAYDEARELYGNYNTVDHPNAFKVLQALNRGAEEFEDEYTVLTRERVVSIKYAQQLQLRSGNISYIYTQAQLQSVFGIPNLTGLSWPNTTGITQPQAMWGWRVRKQEVDFVDSRKVQVNQDWVWAQWSTFLYVPYS